MTETIQIQDQSFTLHPSGALFWRNQQMLLIADVHLGKVSHFRKYGSAVPQQVIQKNFARLDSVIEHFKPKTLCFLGDLFHSYLNNEWLLFEDWVKKSDFKIILIAGNHDVISLHKFDTIGITVGAELILNEFLLSHHPEEREDLFNFCGHIHPSIILNGIAKQRLRLPCFFQSARQLILPAFGEFTGTYALTPTKEDKVYAITQNEVILISGSE